MSDFQMTEEETQDRLDLLLSAGINPDEMPKHIAIIMDGNGRWAKNKGEERIFGHLNGVESVRAVVEAALQTGVRYLTLYAFSTENWNRPKEEVAALMDLLVTTLVKETEDLKGKGVCLSTIGDLKALPKNCQVQLKSTAELNPEPHRLDLILALNYSSKWELIEAVKDIVRWGISVDEIN
jgi:undecaprenyl diphosphate synthase